MQTPIFIDLLFSNIKTWERKISNNDKLEKRIQSENDRWIGIRTELIGTLTRTRLFTTHYVCMLMGLAPGFTCGNKLSNDLPENQQIYI